MPEFDFVGDDETPTSVVDIAASDVTTPEVEKPVVSEDAILKVKKAELDLIIRERVEFEVRRQESSTNAILERTAKVLNELQKVKSETLSEMRVEMAELFASQEISVNIRKELARYVEQEVNSRYKDAAFHKIVGDAIRQHIAENLREIVADVVHLLVVRMDRKYRREFEVTKQLIACSDSEIRHYLMSQPFTQQQADLVEKSIRKVAEEYAQQVVGAIPLPKAIEQKEVEHHA